MASKWLLLVAAVLCCYSFSPSRAQLGVSDEDMQEAVSSLAGRFSAITEEGLGLDSLEVNHPLPTPQPPRPSISQLC